MKILFLSPRISELKHHKKFLLSPNKFLSKVAFTPTLNFRMLSAVTPENYSIKLVDEEIEKIDFDEECDIVGISTTTPTANRAYEIADEFRSRGKPVVIGGWHPSVLSDEAKKHADSVVIGEGEESWPDLLNDFKNEKLKPFYTQKNPSDLKTIPQPDRRKIMHKGGFIIEKIQATRGCVMGCKYCSITNSAYGNVFRFRPIEDIIDEMRSIPHKILYFCDPSLTLNPEYTKELFIEMKKLNKKFYCNGNSSILNRDDELLKLSKDAGCVEWAIGFESICQESLDSIGKISNKLEEFESTVKKIHNHGIGVMGNFMFGLDGDYPDIFEKTVDAISNWDLDLASFNIFTPFPGTPIFNTLEKENRILTRDWSKYDLKHVVFQPKHMSPQELLDGAARAYKDFFSTYSTVNRALRCFRFGIHSFFMTGVENFFRGYFN